MKRWCLAFAAALLLSGTATAGELVLASLSDEPITSRPKAGEQIALTCFKAGEQIQGMNKICFYNCAGSGGALTIKSHQICPLTVSQ